MLMRPVPQAMRSSVRMQERPAPLAGLSLDVPVSQAKPGTALRLDNWICRANGLTLRPGCSVAATESGPILSILSYGTTVFGRTDDVWTGALLPNAGGAHLIATGASGVAPIRYDGAAWHTVGTEGCIASTALRGALTHVRRVWFFAAGSLDIYYLGLDAIGGPLSVLPTAGLFGKGGVVAGIGVVSADGGDMLAIVTTKGQLALYSGTNPDNAATWSLRGVYDTPVPVGVPFVPHATGSGLLTVDGLLRIPDILATGASGVSARALTASTGDLYAPVAGSIGIDSGSQRVLMVHQGATQLVRDAETGGWSRLVGLDATCWHEADGGLYFGRSDGAVCKVGGTSDDGSPITGHMVDAYSTLRSASHKVFRRVRLRTRGELGYRARVETLTDYMDIPASFVPTNTAGAGTASHRMPLWRSIAGRGVAEAVNLSVSATSQFVLSGYDIAWEEGAAV